MRDRLASLRDSAEFAEERLVARAQSMLHECMVSRGLNQTDLAIKMGVSKSRVSQIFSDHQNFTLRLLANAFHALGEEVVFALASEEKRVHEVGGLEFKGIPDELFDYSAFFDNLVLSKVFSEQSEVHLTPSISACNALEDWHSGWATHSELQGTFEKIKCDVEERNLQAKDTKGWAGSNVISLDRKREEYARAC
jgi:transcriptional regulator with XRE-family HTH domain